MCAWWYSTDALTRASYAAQALAIVAGVAVLIISIRNSQLMLIRLFQVTPICCDQRRQHVLGTANPPVGRRCASGPEAEQRLKGGHRLPPTIVPKYELVQVDLQLRLADPVVRANQPLLQLPMARSASGTAEGTPFRRALRIGWFRATCRTPAACSPSKPFSPSL